MKVSNKKLSYSDGWHEVSYITDEETELTCEVFFEDGKIIRALYCQKAYYPYMHSQYGGLDNVSGIKASRKNLEKVIWR